MPLTQPQRDVLASIKNEWNRAEADIKLAEQVANKIVIPSIKELRYAGRRIVDMIHLMLTNPNDEVGMRSLLDDALFDCYRARHDAIDAATTKIALDLDIMVRKLKFEAILPAYPEFPQLWRDLQSIRDRIAQSREHREDREAIYSVIEATDFKVLVATFNAMRGTEQIMRQMATRNRWRDFSGTWCFWLAVVSLLLTLLLDWRDDQAPAASSSPAVETEAPSIPPTPQPK